MRRPLVAVIAAAVAVALLVACGGGGNGDNEGRATTTTTATTQPVPVDVSTPQAVVTALAGAGITCSDLVVKGSETLAVFGINGSESECTVDDLVLGAAVHEAELEIEGGDAVWEEIELLR